MNVEQEQMLGKIEQISMSKETGTTIKLGAEGPVVEVVPDEESASGMSAIVDGERYELKSGANSIGRLESNDIVVNMPTVSREHVVIRVGDEEYSIVDMGSLNGTFFAEANEE
jgi:pSer/pThr/pTyr-binding forkhead associated (FHA) protein